MPTFDGSFEHWLEYRDTFLSLVHNNTYITPIQKFHYLKSSLKSVASTVIDSLEFSSNNYLVAWYLISNTYNNTGLLVHNHVKALFLIKNVKKIRALKLLLEPVDSWDTLIIYLVVSILDSATEREWEQFRSSIPIPVDGSGSWERRGTPVVKLDHLLKFLKDRADMLETLLVTHGSSKTLK